MKLLILAVLCSTVLVSANPISKLSQRVTSFVKSEKAGEYRLPNNTVPLGYTVHLSTRVDKEDFAFTGEVKIDLEIVEPTKSITIHKRQLEIDAVKLECKGEQIANPTHTFDEKTEHLTFDLVNEFAKGVECTLEIKYKGTLRTDNGGFYRSSYTDAAGKTK